MSFAFKDPINYTFTRDFFNVHPVLHIVFNTNKAGLKDFIDTVASGKYFIQWKKDASTEFQYEIMSYRSSFNKDATLVACLCYPRSLVSKAKTKATSFQDIVKNSKSLGSLVKPDGMVIPMGLTPAYILMKIRKDQMNTIAKQNSPTADDPFKPSVCLTSNDNFFLFYDNNNLIADKYSTILQNSASVEIGKMESDIYELFQMEYVDQVNLNNYANVYQNTVLSYMMHTKLYFNSFIIIRCLGHYGKNGVFTFGRGYSFKGLIGDFNGTYILMREVTRKGEDFRTFMFGRHV
jgi:hypothetical protein